MKIPKSIITNLLFFIFLFLFAISVPMLSHALPEEIAINEINFPDANFRSFVDSQYGTGPVGARVIPESNIALIKTMTITNKSISDLTGIEYFTELITLNCDKNQLTALDLSRNTNLQRLNCSSNQLTTLDLSANTMLEVLIEYSGIKQQPAERTLVSK